MKKISYLLTATLGVLVCFVLFNQFNFNYDQAITLLGFSKIHSSEDVIVGVSLSPLNAGKTNKELQVDAMEFYAKNQYDGYILTTAQEKGDDFSTTFGLGTSNIFKNGFLDHIVIDRKLDFDQPFLITNDHQIDNSNNTAIIDYLDHSFYNLDPIINTRYKISSLDFYDLPTKAEYVVVYVSTKGLDVEQVKQNLISEFEKYDQSGMLEHLIAIQDSNSANALSPQKSIWTHYYEAPYPVLITTLIGVILVSILIAFDSSKEIGLRYLNGNSSIHILKSLYLKYYLLTGFIFISSAALFSFILTDSISPLFLKFLISMIPTILTFFSGLIISTLFTYLWLVYNGSVKLLKSKVEFTMFFYIIMVLKLTIMILLFVPLANQIEDYGLKSEWLNTINAHDSFEGSSYVLNAMANSHIPNYQELKNDVSIYIEENDISYADFSLYLDAITFKEDD